MEQVPTRSTGNVNYSQLVEKYNMTDVTDAKTVEEAKNLKAITPEELDKLLSKMFEAPSELMKIGNEFPVIQQKTVSTRANVVVISGSNSDGRADVQLNVDNVDVVNSSVYYTDFMDVFLYYTHLSGSTSKSGNMINFNAKGEVVVKIIFEGTELKKIPTTIEGNYDINRGSGTLTKF